MALVAYESSDDENSAIQADVKPSPLGSDGQERSPKGAGAGASARTNRQPAPSRETSCAPPILGPVMGPMLGPMLGPSRPHSAQPQPRGDGDDDASIPTGLLVAADSPDRDRLRSPYTVTRTLLRDLTLPAVPNMDVPASPPGTPPPSAEALTRKFDHFLELKRARAVHFNARLASSAAMRDPSVTDKMLEFAGMGGLADQYVTTLPGALWHPRALPDWAVRGRLRESQERVRKERERGRGEPLRFVRAEAEAQARPAPASAPAGDGVGRKTRFDQ